MRFKKAPLFQLAACLVVFAFLFGAATASALDRDERASKDPRQIHKPYFFKSVGVGKFKGQPSFFKDSAEDAGCTSGCCWAEANCAGGTADCSESSCVATCPDGSRASYTCNAS